jgi:hypothetical protein
MIRYQEGSAGMKPGREFVGRLTARSGLACIAILAATQAHALAIDAGFETSITSAPDATAIETAIDTAVDAIAGLYSNPGTVNILFTAAAGHFLGDSDSGLNVEPYSTYVGQLAANSAANPSNTTLSTAITNLPYGNDANGAKSIVASTALLRVALGDTNVTPCFNAGGSFVTGCGQTYDGVITLSNTQPLSYTRPVTSGSYDAIRVIEHETDEILGGGGAGSTLNAVANNSVPLSSFYGPLDLYRYGAAHTPSFTASTSATAYFSVDGGVTNIVGFNQNQGLSLANYGDFGDFLSTTGCPDYVQDAFTCPNQQADETASSPEFQMMQAIGWDGATDPVPEPTPLALLGAAIGGLAFVRSRPARRSVGTAE